MTKMKEKILIALIIILLIVAGVFWWQKRSAENEKFLAQQELRKNKIAQDSLVKLSDGYYQKLVADTLTKRQLKKLAEKVTELGNREPVSVTTTIIQPVKIVKDTDQITVEQDSAFIKDYYPNKESPFLEYTNKFSLVTQKGFSQFNFSPITLKQVVTKKENGLYQVDFKGPNFLELKSLNIQTEPIKEPVKDNWGTLVGAEYGKNLESDISVVEINLYQRYKKFYLGGAISSNKDLKAGAKIEF